MRSLLVTALTLVWLLGGCAPKIVDEPVTFDLTRPAIDVDLFAGDVTVVVDDRYSVTTVHLVRRTQHGMLRGEDARASLEHIDAGVELVGRDGASVIEVRASTVDPEPHFQEVSVRITTPTISSLRIRTMRGAIELREVGGPLDIETTDAGVNLRTTRPLNDPVTIATSNAPITVRVPGDSRCTIDLETIFGNARVQTPDAVTTNVASSGPGSIQATLNGGTNPVILRTTKRDISFQAVADVIARGNYDG